MSQLWSLILGCLCIAVMAAPNTPHVWVQEECDYKCKTDDGYVTGSGSMVPLTSGYIWEDEGGKSRCSCVLNQAVINLLDNMDLNSYDFQQKFDKSKNSGKSWLKKHGLKVEFLKLPSYKSAKKDVESSIRG